MKVKGVVALTPGHVTVSLSSGCVGLAIDAWLHNVIFADGTGFHLDIP